MGENAALPKPPWEWEQVDVQKLVDDKTPEDLHIEYKESRLLAKTPPSAKEHCIGKLTKTVSAFNNADGGVIIIGIKEAKEEERNYPRGFDEGINEAEFDKTWLVQIINSNISPPIPDLRVKPIKLSGDNAGKVAYVIWIPKGTRAVQARDLIYYQRVEDQSLPMRDYQIQDVNNRSIGPDLRLSFEIPLGQDNILTQAGNTSNTAPFRIAVVAKNLSDTVAELALFTIIVPQRLAPTEPTGFHKINLQPRIALRYNGRDTLDNCRVFQKYHRAPDFPPIFRQVQPTMIGNLNVTFKAAYEQSPHYEPLLWFAESPRMQPKSGCNIIVTDGHQLELKTDTEASITLDDKEPLDYWKDSASP